MAHPASSLISIHIASPGPSLGKEIPTVSLEEVDRLLASARKATSLKVDFFLEESVLQTSLTASLASISIKKSVSPLPASAHRVPPPTEHRLLNSEHEERMYESLTDMGFEHETVVFAIKTYGEDDSAVLDFCHKVMQLMEMGYEAKDTYQALQFHNRDLDKVLELFLS